MTHRIPKPEWKFSDLSDDGKITAIPYFEEVANGLTRKMWEVEDNILTTEVVKLLRSKGWTVEPPKDTEVWPEYDR